MRNRRRSCTLHRKSCSTHLVRTLLVVSLAALPGCAMVHVILPEDTTTLQRTVTLNHHPIALHMANHKNSTHPFLLLYATGDGGWHRKDLDLFRQLTATGFPVAGFDARDYVTHFDTKDTTTPMRLGRDYIAMINEARTALELDPTTKVILVGVSRGADLSVVAAAQRLVRRELAGVVAIALRIEEEYVRRLPLQLRRPAPVATPSPDDEPTMAAPYESIRRFGALPLAVIQSTHDNYLPASEARKLFGPDTQRHHFEAIESSNHSFGGARNAMYGAVREALGWIEGLSSR
jgi:pimeloyl-ACP methyl ester carboxylesterase